MRTKVIIDTGPLLAFLRSNDKYHDWVSQHLADITPPLLTCESVLSEACFLLQKTPNAAQNLLELIKRGILQFPLRIEEEVTAITKLLKRYANVPISLADACLVRMSENYPDSLVLTLDSDFHIYRKHDRHAIPLIIPA